MFSTVLHMFTTKLKISEIRLEALVASRAARAKTIGVPSRVLVDRKCGFLEHATALQVSMQRHYGVVAAVLVIATDTLHSCCWYPVVVA